MELGIDKLKLEFAFVKCEEMSTLNLVRNEHITRAVLAICKASTMG
jgi:hypothetical protein